MTNKASVDADIAAALAEMERAGLKLVLTIRNGLVFFAAILIIATQGVEGGGIRRGHRIDLSVGRAGVSGRRGDQQ